MKQWSTLRKLLLLRLIMGGGVPIETMTATGTSPLSLANAIAHSILSLTQTGKCEQASTPTPTSPVDIKCNNGVVKAHVNLWSAYEDGYMNASGGVTATSGYKASNYIPIDPNKKYTCYAENTDPVSGAGVRICFYNSSQTFIGTRQGGQASDAGKHIFIATPPDNTAAYLRVSFAYSAKTKDQTVMEGEYTIDTMPVLNSIYADGTPEVITVTHADSTTQTAGAENLFAVGDYADTQEIISGAVTRNCGVLVFDGTEDWTRTSIGDGCTVFSIEANAHSISGWSKITSLCTNFECYVGSTAPTYIAANAGKFWLNTAGQYFRFVVAGTMTLTQFTAWLTEQYEAGTPVIVIYPLAEPTTETVTGQPLSTTAGTNTVSWTAEVSGKTMSAEYKGSTAYSNKVGTGKVGYMKI